MKLALLWLLSKVHSIFDDQHKALRIEQLAKRFCHNVSLAMKLHKNEDTNTMMISLKQNRMTTT